MRLLLLLSASLSLNAQAPLPFTWTGIGPLSEARHSACGVRLPDGRFVIIGGQGTYEVLASIEIIGPDLTFSAGKPLQVARYDHTCTALDDGSILVTGGRTEFGPLDSAELWTPADEVWTLLDSAPLARFHHTAIALPTGVVVIAGGEIAEGPTAAVEIYSPFERTFRKSAATLSSARTGHTAVLLRNGDVEFIGGTDGASVLSTVDRLRAEDETIVASFDLPSPRRHHSSTVLEDGRILIAGGHDGRTDLASALLYDDAKGTWSDAGSMTAARSRHMAQRIPGNGGVVLAGGIQGTSTYLESTELFDPTSGQFVAGGNLLAPRTDAVINADTETGVVFLLGGFAGDRVLNTCGAASAPSISVSKPAYLVGETVTVLGTSYPANTAVNLQVTGIRSDGSTAYTTTFSTSTNSFGKFTLTLPAAAAMRGLTNTVLATASGVPPLVTSFRVVLPCTCTITRTASFFGDPVGVPIDVTGKVTGSPGVPVTGGIIRINRDGFLVAGSAVNNSDGTRQALFSLSFSPGAHTARILYEGDANYAPCTSGQLPVTVRKRSTRLRLILQRGDLVVSPSNVILGDSIQMLGIVDDEFTGAAVAGPSITNYLSFDLGDSIAFIPVTSTSTTPPSSQAARNLPALPLGPFTLTLHYEGDANYNPSDLSVSGLVNRIPTSVRLRSTPGTPVLGQTISLTATVTGSNGASPTGEVNFSGFGGTRQATLSPSTRGESVATINNVLLTRASSFNLRGTYNGDASFAPSDGTVVVTPSRAPTTISVSVLTPDPIQGGQNTTIRFRLNVNIASSNVSALPNIHGQAQLYLDGDHVLYVADFFGEATSEQTTVNITSGWTAGTHTLRGTYFGDSNYLRSDSPTVTFVVH